MKDPNKIIDLQDLGIFNNIADHLKLVWRLWTDPRVNLFLKILPLGSIVYMISPLDMVVPIIDDIGVLWFFTYIFIELCPDEIVEEHRHDLKSTITGIWRDTKNEEPPAEFDEESIQEAEFEDIED